MAADLHCHTKLSDGSVGLEDLIAIAKKSNIDTIAITDHDCLAGTVRGKIVGERHGVNVIPGVELSAYDFVNHKNVHILCYLADSPDRLEGLCRRTALARKRASQVMALKVANRFPVSVEFILRQATGSTNLYKQHIMQALMDAGYTTSIYGELYDALFSRESENNVICPVKYPDVYEVMTEVHAAGGIAVLAHPGVYDNFDIIDDLVQAGLDGIEVWHPGHDEALTERAAKAAKTHKLLMTGGSDFHGLYNSKPVTLGTCSTPKENLDKLMSYKSKRKRAIKKIEKEQLALREAQEKAKELEEGAQAGQA